MIDVQIVRNRRSLEDSFAAVLFIFLKAWIVMLLVPLAFPGILIGFWQAIAIGIVVSFLFGKTDYLHWTKERM